ncbi:MAG: M3 family oligoendopeptidase [Anaerolineae bacterium]
MENSKTMTALPHWDMSVIFPGLESSEFQQAFDAVVAGVAALDKVFDKYGVGHLDVIPPLDTTTIQAVEEVFTRLNAVLAQVQTVGAYIAGFITTNSRDTVAQARQSAFQQQLVPLHKLDTRLTAWAGALDVEALIEQSEVAREHAFLLRQSKVSAQHLMPFELEALATELSLTGGSAWSRLHGNVTSQLVVLVELEGRTQELPMSAMRNLAFHPDRAVRERAYTAELATWERAATPLAAALNSIKGEVNTLAKRRGWESALDAAVFQANIDRQTLDALMEAARESFPDFRRYLHAKARALGIERMAWFDIFAPVGHSQRVWEYPEATAFIVEQFGTYSPRLQALAARAFAEHWIDAEPRPGKRDGAFCMGIRRDESRVLSNFKAAYGGMSTLAHELGHAYHNHVKAHRTMLQKDTPMTLAETASIFCETIVRQAALQQADPEEQLMILEASLQDSTQVVVDIISRFIFEQRVFEKRWARELSIDEFKEYILDAQRETYGDGLDPDKLHPYMWAVKGHYYSTGLSFYNFPYLFGLLFGLGLYRRYQQAPEEFTRGYDDLLASTGMADAATLAARFGIDIRTPDFWRSSLDIIREDVQRFEGLIAAQDHAVLTKGT